MNWSELYEDTKRYLLELMKIKIIGHDGKIFSQPSIKNPWNVFHQQFINAGHSMVESLDQSCDVLISNSHSKDQIKLCEKNRVLRNNRFLILWEPRQTNPQIHSKRNISKYGTVFTPSRNWVSGEQVNDFNWPQGSKAAKNEEFYVWKQRKNKSIIIASNKYSFVKGEQYSLRRAVTSDKSAGKLIDVAGHDWDLKIKSLCSKIVKSLWRSRLKDFSIESFSNLLPKLTNYIGSIESKDQISIRYRIALVVENSSDYVSEKLFDALSCENIVVYVGPELKHFGLNDQMVIRVAPNINSIFSELKNILHLNEEEQFKILERQQQEYKKIVGEWDNRAVLEKMAKDILEKIPSKPTE
jgi:hypothetical protein